MMMKKKSKKRRIGLIVGLSVVIIALTTVICVRKSKPRYSYLQINKAFWIGGTEDTMGKYVDANYYYDKKSLIKTAQYLNLYNDMLYNKKERSTNKYLSLDEVLDFYSSEYDENGEPRIMHLPTKIEDYLDWYWRHGLSAKGPKVDFEKAHNMAYITTAMYKLGCFSERKYTKELSDVVIDDPVAFYVGLYVYNRGKTSDFISEDEIIAAMAGESVEPLERFGNWVFYLGDISLEDFYNNMKSTYMTEYVNEYPSDNSFSDLDLSEIKKLIEYMENSGTD